MLKRGNRQVKNKLDREYSLEKSRNHFGQGVNREYIQAEKSHSLEVLADFMQENGEAAA